MFGFGKKKNKDDRKMSAGEIVFDRGVYTGINFFVNETLSLMMGVEFRHFGGKTRFDKATKWWQKTVGFKDVTKNGVTTSGFTRAGDSLEIFTLLGSGTILMVPMKLLEDHKQKIVKNLNHLLDKLSGHQLDEAAAKARDEEVEKAIACEPKQTWKSMILGRAVATVNNMFLVKETLFAGDRTQKTKDWSEKYMRLGVDKLHQATGGKPGSRLDKLRSSERFKRYSEIIGLETAYTAISAVVMELASKFIASKKPVIKDPELCAKSQSEDNAAEIAAAGGFEPAATKSFASKIPSCKVCKVAASAPSSSYVEKIAVTPDQQVQQTL